MQERIAPLFRSGVIELVIATGVAGAAGYALTLLAGIELGPASYVSFGVLWSSIFFAVGTLNGLQQEVARATRSASTGFRSAVVRDVTLGIAALVFFSVLSTSALWVPRVFALGAWWLALPIALGLAGHTITTSLVGMLHGLRQTRLIALAVVVDAILRLCTVLVAIDLTHDLGPVSWALICPYLLMPFVIWARGAKRFKSATIDVNRLELVRHSVATLIAAAASGVLISGISLFIAAAGSTTAATRVGAVIFAVNVTRAPLIIVVGALQNLIVVRLRDRTLWLPLFLQLSLIVALATVVLTVLAGLVGKAAIALLLRGAMIEPALMCVIVASGGLVALMTVSGAAIIARGRHTANTAGWIVAAFTTVVAFFVLPTFDLALPAGLIAGPVAGLLVHASAIAVAISRRGQSTATVSPEPRDPEF
jgi:hypothetical protein